MNRQISDTLHLLWSQYNEEEFCNVTVHCHDEKRFCNSFMLMTLSQFWTEVISDSNTADSTIHVLYCIVFQSANQLTTQEIN